MKEKILSIINKYTPRADYLAHYYWGDILWSNIGYVLAIIIAFIYPSYTLIILPLISVAIPAWSKEKRDGQTNSDGTTKGDKDLKDFLYTILPSIPKVMILWLLIYLIKNTIV